MWEILAVYAMCQNLAHELVDFTLVLWWDPSTNFHYWISWDRERSSQMHCLPRSISITLISNVCFWEQLFFVRSLIFLNIEQVLTRDSCVYFWDTVWYLNTCDQWPVYTNQIRTINISLSLSLCCVWSLWLSCANS